MKTAFESIVSDNECSSIEKISALRNLIQISKKIPWIKDPRVKFLDFKNTDLSSCFQIFAMRVAYGWYNWYYIYINHLPEECWSDPNRFMEHVTEVLGTQSKWMQVEDRI